MKICHLQFPKNNSPLLISQPNSSSFQPNTQHRLLNRLINISGRNSHVIETHQRILPKLPKESEKILFNSIKEKEYIEIYKDIKREQEEHPREILNLERHKGISQIHLAILFDWFVNLFYVFGYSDECLYTAVNIVKRFLNSKGNYSKEDLLLIGSTAMLISTKYVDRRPIALENILSKYNGMINKDKVKDYEINFLKSIDWNIKDDGRLACFDILCLTFNINKKEYVLGKFLLELTLLDISFDRHNVMLLSYSVIYVVMKYYIDNHQNYHMIYEYAKKVGINDKDIKKVAEEIFLIQSNITSTKSNYTSSLEKYYKETKRVNEGEEDKKNTEEEDTVMECE
ncbi:MAG: cyclin [archaeon]|nr:cyclin [archaeon]